MHDNVWILGGLPLNFPKNILCLEIEEIVILGLVAIP